MSKTFKEVKKKFFKKSTHVIDRYHFIRQVIWALENVRKTAQKNMLAKERKYFKRSKSILKKPAKKLKEEEIQKLTLMLEMSPEIKEAYKLKELFYEYVLKQDNKERASKALRMWIFRVKNSGNKHWNACVRSFENWFEEITNSFDYEWTNAFVEGTHNKIKVLKRVCFGSTNFNHFRTRILLI